MAASVDSPSPSHLSQGTTGLMASSSPFFSPSADRRFWSSLRSRIDTLLDQRNSNSDPNMLPQLSASKSERAKRLKEDSQLLLRGFDSISHSLSQLSNSLDNALQGARELAKPPTLTEIVHSRLVNSEVEEERDSEKGECEKEHRKGMKRKFDLSHCTEEPVADSDKQEDDRSSKDTKLKKAKNLAITMATKAATLARELKSLRSNLCFAQERCALLEEENRRLRDGFAQGIRPEEDDLVRLQLEALLAEKSRLATENGNLVRENQCLHQLVEYHQLTSQDLSESYEQVIEGLRLDFSSPPPAIEEEENAGDSGGDDYNDDDDSPPATMAEHFGSSCSSLDKHFQEEE